MPLSILPAVLMFLSYLGRIDLPLCNKTITIVSNVCTRTTCLKEVNKFQFLQVVHILSILKGWKPKPNSVLLKFRTQFEQTRKLFVARANTSLSLYPLHIPFSNSGEVWCLDDIQISLHPGASTIFSNATLYIYRILNIYHIIIKTNICV